MAMEAARDQRRLAAVLAADVVSYRRLMAADCPASATVRQIEGYC
jgi:class 3 adenylate cyclase